MAKLIIPVIAILFSGCASLSKTEFAWQTMHAIDIAQTLNSAASSDQCWRESGIPTKYLIGEKPDPEAVIAWGIGLSVLHYYAARWVDNSDLSDGWKTAIRSIDLGNKGAIIVENHIEGARPFGDNARSCI